MKLKFSKKYRWIGIGTTVGLSTIALSACTPVLVSCNSINETDPIGPNGGTNNQGGTQKPHSVILNVDCSILYNTLNETLTSNEWDVNETVEAKIVDGLKKATKGSNVKYKRNTLFCLKPNTNKNDGEITFDVTVNSKYRLVLKNNSSKNVVFDSKINTFTIKNLATKASVPDNPGDTGGDNQDHNGDQDHNENQDNNKVVFQSDVLIDAINKKTKKYGIPVWKLQPYRFKKSLTDAINKVIGTASNNILSDAAVTIFGTIANTQPGTTNIGIIKFTVQGDLSNLKFDPTSGVSTEGTNTIVVKGCQLRNSFEDVGYDLFNFDNFTIPSQVNKSALVVTDYANCTDAINDADQAGNIIRNMYHVLLAKTLGLDKKTVYLDPNRINKEFEFTFNVDLTENICQRLYHTSFNSIKELFEKSENYNELFREVNEITSPIDSIQISFSFSKFNGVVNDHLLGLKLTQSINFTFQDNYKKTITVNSMNNCYSDLLEYQTIFLIDFIQSSNYKKGDVAKINTVNISQQQEDELNDIIHRDLRNWTKKEVLDTVHYESSLPENPNDSNNPKYVKIINDVNTFLKNNNIGVEIWKMSFSIGEATNEGDGLSGVTPFFYIKEFNSMLEFPDTNMIFTPGEYSVHDWVITYNSEENSNNVPINVNHDTLELSSQDLITIKTIVTENISKMTNMVFNSNDKLIQKITNEVNNYIATVNNKFVLQPTIWGGKGSYQFNERNANWTMSLGFFVNYKDPKLNETDFAFLNIADDFDDKDVETCVYDFYSTLVFNNLETNILPEVVVSQEIAKNINQILTDFAATITTKESPNSLFNNHPDVVNKLNTELAKINNKLKVAGFNVWGGWDAQGNANNKKTIRLSITLNNLPDIGYTNQSMLIKSDLFWYSRLYNTIVPNIPYQSNINPSLIIKDTVAKNIDQIMSSFCATLTIQESNEDLFKKHSAVVRKLNAELAKINNKLVVAGFNVWGGWQFQNNDSEGHRTVRLAIILNNIEDAGYSEKDVIIESNLFSYDKKYNAIVPPNAYKTNIQKAFIIDSTTINNIKQILTDFTGNLTTQESNQQLLDNHQDVVNKINEQLAKIDNRVKLSKFNVWGDWVSQGSSNGYKTVRLSFGVNNLADLGYYDNYVAVQSYDFDYNGRYHVIVPWFSYQTKIPA